MKNSFTKILLLILFVCYSWSYNAKGQILITYNYENKYFTQKSQLLVDDGQAQFSILPVNKTGNDIITIDDKSNNSITILKDSDTAIYFSTSKDSVITMSLSDSKGSRYLVKDNAPKIIWIVYENERKMISGYNCYKAKGIFRGREYVAYFTDELPIPFGPFKFKGLPGLILDIKSVENDLVHHWYATEVISNPKQFNYFVLDEIEDPTISLFQFLEIENLYKKNRELASSSRLPKGVQLKSSSSKRLGPELIYEWELENDKN